MKCRSCDYPLWNLATRRCPECGATFRPSEYDFRANAVEFCCPHCKQAYYGTSDRGHLVPRSFSCVQCGASLEMDSMVLRPAPGVHENETEMFIVPWHERAVRGRIRAFLQTTGLVMTQPTRLASGLARTDRSGDAWSYMLSVLGLIALGTMLTSGLFVLFFFWTGGPFGAGGPQVSFAVASMMILPLAMALIGGVIVIAWAGATHLVLMISGRAPKPFARTNEAICYATGPLVILAIPVINFCGTQYLIPLWSVVAACLLVWKLQGVHGGRATLAALTLPALVMLLPVAGYIFASVARVTTATTWSQPQAIVVPSQNARQMASGLIAFTATNNRQWPAHMYQAMGASFVTPQMFIDPRSRTVLGDIEFGDTTLDAFSGMTTQERQAEIIKAVNAMPPNVVAYRVGDFVFTYPGVSLSAGPRGLWLFVVSPDPDATSFDGRSINRLVVGLDNGLTQGIPPGQFAAALKQQNSLRSGIGLPAIPDPRTVQQGVPVMQEADE